MNYKKFKQIILDTLDQNGPTEKIILMMSLQKYACDTTFDKSFNELVTEGHLHRIHVPGQYRSRDVISLSSNNLVMTEPVKPLPPVPAPQTYTYVDAVLMMVNDNVSVSVPGASTSCEIQDGKIMWCDVALEVHQLFVLTDEYPYTREEAIAAFVNNQDVQNSSSSKRHNINDNEFSWLKFTRFKIYP